jgi:negative regulator of sigma E activity
MWNRSKNQCEQYAAMLEDAPNAERGEKPALGAELAAHVSNCEHCRESAGAFALSRSLLRSGLEPAAVPGPYFSSRVMAAIHAEENRRASQRVVFWSPLEHLAARMAVVAATIVLLLSFYVYAVAPQISSEETAQAQSYELVPHQQVDQPQTKDEVLMSLVEANNNGR